MVGGRRLMRESAVHGALVARGGGGGGTLISLMYGLYGDDGTHYTLCCSHAIRWFGAEGEARRFEARGETPRCEAGGEAQRFGVGGEGQRCRRWRLMRKG